MNYFEECKGSQSHLCEYDSDMYEKMLFCSFRESKLYQHTPYYNIDTGVMIWKGCATGDVSWHVLPMFLSELLTIIDVVAQKRWGGEG